jgi:alpha-D-ribose 1-methylphosphonate 5-triphosphate synthase subunit PhnG
MDESEIAADVEARRAVMRTLAHASDSELHAAVAILEPLPAFADLRPPEVGLIMLRGRIGGDGVPFNVGEATVTRAAVRLESGENGFSYLIGRRPQSARLSAVVDALWQRQDWKARIESDVVLPLHERQMETAARRRAQTAATKVDFFTVARGEDP